MRFIKTNITMMICLLFISPMGTATAINNHSTVNGEQQQLQILGVMPTPAARLPSEQPAAQQKTTATPAASTEAPATTESTATATSVDASPAPSAATTAPPTERAPALHEQQGQSAAGPEAAPAAEGASGKTTAVPTNEQIRMMEKAHGMAPGAMQEMMHAMEAAHEEAAEVMAEDNANAHHEKTARSPHHGSLHWGYQGAGAPYYWGDLKEEFATCKSGRHQSPIDISAAVITSLPDIQIHYNDTAFNVVNNGHAIQVNYQKGSYILVAGKRYNLLQFHFHSPSEHTIGGKRYDMVAHLVHQAGDGQLAVIALMMKQGRANPLIEALWAQLPKTGDTNTIADKAVNVRALLPHDKSYFNYSGSLTTPPCSEDVNWMVLTAPVEVSADQIARFRQVVPYDARPVQAINGRTLRLSN